MYSGYNTTSDKNVFIEKYLKSNGDITTKEKFYNSLLSEAILEEDADLVKHIFKLHDRDMYPTLLTDVDNLNMSPLAISLLFDDKDSTRYIIKHYIGGDYIFHKIKLTKPALLKLNDIISFRGKSCLKIMNDLITPIIIEDQVELLREAGTKLFSKKIK